MFFMSNVAYMVHPLSIYPAAKYVRHVFPKHKWFFISDYTNRC